MAKKDKDWWVAYRAKKKAEKQAQETVAQPLFATVCNDLQPATDVASATGKNTTDGATPVASATAVAQLGGQRTAIDDTIPDKSSCNRNLLDAKDLEQEVRRIMGDIIKFPYDDWTKFKDSIIGDPAKLFPIREEVADATRKLEQEMQRLHENQKDLEAQLQVQPEPEQVPPPEPQVERMAAEANRRLEDQLSKIISNQAEIEAQLQVQPVAQPDFEQAQPQQPVAQLVQQPKLQSATPLKTITTQLRMHWKPIFGMAVLVMFLTANTIFLVSEQFSFYRAFGYSLSWSLVIAVLSELALITFSALSSATKSWRWKLPMSVMSMATSVMILGVLSSNIEQRSSEQTADSEEVKSLKNRQASIEALRGSAIADMNSLDPKVYPKPQK